MKLSIAAGSGTVPVCVHTSQGFELCCHDTRRPPEALQTSYPAVCVYLMWDYRGMALGLMVRTKNPLSQPSGSSSISPTGAELIFSYIDEGRSQRHYILTNIWSQLHPTFSEHSENVTGVKDVVL